MKVKDLILLLSKCNPEDSVVYDAQDAIANEGWVLIDSSGENITDSYPHFSVDDVQIGKGTLRGNVYLCAEPYPEMQ